MCSIMAMKGRDVTLKEFEKHFSETISRGPDMTRIIDRGDVRLGFHRLSIMGHGESGMQPFLLGDDCVICNGEIYGFAGIKRELEKKGYTFQSSSDCEVLLPLWKEYGVKMFGHLDAEFALVISTHHPGRSLLQEIL